MAVLGAPTRAQHVEGAVEALTQIVETERAQAGRGQLDQERYPLEATTELGDAPAVEMGGRVDVPGPLHEEGGGGVIGQRSQGHHLFLGQTQALPTRGQHGGVGVAQDPLRHDGRSVVQVLAIVQHDEQRRCGRPASSALRPAGSTMPRRPARTRPTVSPSAPGASGARSTNTDGRPCRVRSASRVLPMPPGPTTVTSRAAISSASRAGSSWRPTSDVTIWLRYPAGLVDAVGHSRRSPNDQGRQIPTPSLRSSTDEDVTLHRAQRYEESLRELGVRQPLPDEFEDLVFTGGDVHDLNCAVPVR